MNQPKEHQAVIDAATNIQTTGEARRLLDALHQYGVAWHPEETFAEIYARDTGERTFTDDEASQLDAAIEKVERLLGSAGMYVCAMEIQMVDADAKLLHEAGIDSITIGPRRIPACPGPKVDFDGAIPLLLKQVDLSCDKADPGYEIKGHQIRVWEAEDPDALEGTTKWSFAIADVDQEGNVITTSEMRTQSASMFVGEVQARIARRQDAAVPDATD